MDCGNLYELYINEGAFGAHEDYLFETLDQKSFYLSNAYLYKTYAIIISTFMKNPGFISSVIPEYFINKKIKLCELN